MCSADPQIVVVVTLMMTSRGLRMTGSGTVSTWIFSLPSQQTARMDLFLRGSRRSRNLAGFEQLLEVPEILADGLRRCATEEGRDKRSGPPRRWGGLQVHVHLCAATTACRVEGHRSRGHDLRPGKRPPREDLVLDLINN